MYSLNSVYHRFKCTRTSTSTSACKFTEAADESVRGYIKVLQTQLRPQHCKGRLANSFTDKNLCALTTNTVSRKKPHTPWGDTVYCKEQQTWLPVMWSQYDDWLVPLSAPTPSVGGRRSLHQYSFPFSHLYSCPHSYSSLDTQSRLGSFVCISAHHCLRWRGGGLPWSSWHWHHFVSAGGIKLSPEKKLYRRELVFYLSQSY